MTQKIDSQGLDVIVIGAGPAGGSCARECAKRGLKVLLVERSQEIGEPNYSTAGTPKETIESFGIPEHVLSASWKKILLATPRVSALWEYPEVMGYVFDFAGLRKFLAEDAAKWGAEIMVGTAVKDFVIEEGNIAGVSYHGVFGSGEARAPVIVDATGHHAFGNAKLQIHDMDRESLADAMEYQMTNHPLELKDTLANYIGSEYAPHGYAWVYPMNKNDDAKVGICRIGPMPKGENLESFQERFIASIPFFAHMEPTEIHAGAACLDGGVKEHVYKNIIFVGDSAHQINPLAGEGIRHALHAGRMAAEVIGICMRDGVLDQVHLKKEYEARWHHAFGHRWYLSHVFKKYVFLKFNDPELDSFVEILKTISPEDIFDVIFHYDFEKFLKYPKVVEGLLALEVDVIHELMKE